jgi:hypothetical protein
MVTGCVRISVKGTQDNGRKSALLPVPTPASVAKYATDQRPSPSLINPTCHTARAPWHLRAVCDKWCMCTMKACDQNRAAKRSSFKFKKCAPSRPVAPQFIPSLLVKKNMNPITLYPFFLDSHGRQRGAKVIDVSQCVAEQTREKLGQHQRLQHITFCLRGPSRNRAAFRKIHLPLDGRESGAHVSLPWLSQRSPAPCARKALLVDDLLCQVTLPAEY